MKERVNNLILKIKCKAAKNTPETFEALAILKELWEENKVLTQIHEGERLMGKKLDYSRQEKGNCFEKWGRLMANSIIATTTHIDYILADKIEDEKMRSLVLRLQAENEELKRKCIEEFMKERTSIVYGIDI